MIQLILDACGRLDISSAQVVNVDQLDSTVAVHIPEYLSLKHDIVEVCNYSNSSPIQFDRQKYTSWITIDKNELDLSIGLHRYGIHLISRFCENTHCWLYFSYYAQSSQQERDYIYMKRGENNTNEVDILQ